MKKICVMTARLLAAAMLMVAGLLMPQKVGAEEHEYIRINVKSVSDNSHPVSTEHNAYRVIDQLDLPKSTYWCSIEEDEEGNFVPFHIILKNESGYPLHRYSLTEAPDVNANFSNYLRNWKSWTIYGTNDNPEEGSAEWTKICSEADQVFRGWWLGSYAKTYYFLCLENQVAYAYYKFEVTELAGKGGSVVADENTHRYVQAMADLSFYTLDPTCPDGHDWEESTLCSRCDKITPPYYFIADNANGYLNQSGENLFDGDLRTIWLSGIGSNNAWVEFKTYKPVTVHAYHLSTINSLSRMVPDSWKLQAKLHESDEWTDLAVEENNRDMSPEKYYYDIGGQYPFEIDEDKQHNFYQYFRLEVTHSIEYDKYTHNYGYTYRTALSELTLEAHCFNSKNQCMLCSHTRCEDEGHVWVDGELKCRYCDATLPDYLSFKAVGGDVTIDMKHRSSMSSQLEYTLDRYDWTTFDAAVALPEGRTCYFRAKEQQYLNSLNPKVGANLVHFAMDSDNHGRVEAGGSLMSLISPSGNAKKLGEFAFAELFYGCYLLTTAPKLTATELEDYCYSELFAHCTNLESDIYLPVKEFPSMAFHDWLRKTKVQNVHFPYEAIPSVREAWRVTDEGNIVFDADTITLSDNAAFMPADYPVSNSFTKAKQVSYSREMTQQWGTLCLPFQITVDEADDFELYVVQSADDKHVTLQRVTDQLAAGQGAIVRRKAGSSTICISASDAQLRAKPLGQDESPVESGWRILGNFVPKDLDVSKSYLNGYYLDAADGLLHNMHQYYESDNQHTTLSFPRFHAYLQNEGNTRARTYGINVGNMATDLIQVLNNEDNNAIYGLDGQPRSELGEGLNIMRRKDGSSVKIIVR